MPDGKTHAMLWKYGIPMSIVIGCAVGIFEQDVSQAALFVVGYGLGRYIDPDLDLLGVTSAEGRMFRELKVFGAFLAGWFLPYAYIMGWFGGHRSFISHFPGISTLIRLVWMVAPIWLILWFGFDIFVPIEPLISIFAGLTLADLIHFGADMLM